MFKHNKTNGCVTIGYGILGDKEEPWVTAAIDNLASKYDL